MSSNTMSSPVIVASFALVACVGIVSLAFGNSNSWLITGGMVLMTGTAFLALILLTLKPKSRHVMLTRIAAMPLPKSLSPLRWFCQLIFGLVLISGLLITSEIYHFRTSALNILLELAVSIWAIYLFYLVLFGSVRYLVKPQKDREQRLQEKPPEAEFLDY